MKILIIEDEPKTAAFLEKGLRENGFVVDLAPDGEEGAHLASSSGYDFIVLDILLPKRDGWSVLKEIREAGNETPVLILSACDSTEERVRGLELGADDYLAKPFAFSELLARVRTVLRRAPERRPETLKVDDLELDFVRQKAVRAGQRLDLTPKELALLGFLMRHVGQVVSRTLISEKVWDMNFDSLTNVVDVHVRRLRSKIDDPFERKLIHTVRGVGYVLDPSF
ncbi:MAG: heavy metal response regulator transcription factor [Planctomycetota bacterium]